MSDEKFDVTTLAGLKAANKFMDSNWAWVLFPGWKMAYDWLSAPSDVSPEKQAEAAEKIIEAGRKNGAKRIKMKVDKHVGAKLKGDLGEDINIETSVGTDGTMELEVEYK